MDECFSESALPNDDEDDDDDEESIQGDAVKAEMVEDNMGIVYPQPTLSMAVHPTCPRVAGHHLISTYAGLNGLVLPSDRFDTWHKLTICHQPLPFAPHKPPHCDMAQVQPPKSGSKIPSLFETVMFVNNPQAVGVQRYHVDQ
ncbi:hypothetical protein FRC06_010327, partial [Ceratobasidium sp. 370]